MSAPTTQRARIPVKEGLDLAAVVHRPAERPKGSLVLAHCFTCSKDYKLIAWLSLLLADRGWIALRFDFRGLGQSDGDFAVSTLTDDVADLIGVCRWLSAREIAPSGLIGHSFGGTAAILAAPTIPSVEAVAVIGTSAGLSRIADLLTADHREQLARTGVAEVPVVGRPHGISREFLEDLDNHSVEAAMKGWRRRLAVLHGTEDELVPAGESEELFRLAPQPKAFIPLIGADHLVTSREQAESAAGFLDGWFSASGWSAS